MVLLDEKKQTIEINGTIYHKDTSIKSIIEEKKAIPAKIIESNMWILGKWGKNNKVYFVFRKDGTVTDQTDGESFLSINPDSPEESAINVGPFSKCVINWKKKTVSFIDLEDEDYTSVALNKITE